ncbi:MAG: SDR family NAD(P)-dependent oxidoreductase, partial [Actinomadura rubrobrunea]|nr:SDR family NAD(P)-dependent oxidoreductase [Actinomadura rubrobrunea]
VDLVAYRSGRRRAARLRRTGVPAAGPAARIHGDAAYLITGGRGSLGLRVADRLAAEGARHLILTGRRPLPEDGSDAASAAIRRLRERGVTVHTPAVDVADAEAMARLLRPDGDAPWPAVRGVVHAAGTFEAATVREMIWERFRSVLRPKVEGTLVLDALTRDADLDFFVVFSSASAVWGSASAGHYAAGNCFADLMAHDRARRGLPGLSIDWGWWEGSDLVAEEHLRHFASIGLAPVTDALGLAALDRLLASERRQVTVAPVDWSRYRPMLEARRRRPLLALMAAEPAGASASAGDAALLAALRRAPSRQAPAPLLEERVQREVAAVLGLPADAPPMERDRGFFDAGMDSIMSVEVRDRLQDALGVDLPPTAAFENPTVASLTEFLLARLDDLTWPAEPAGAAGAGEAAGPAAAGA